MAGTVDVHDEPSAVAHQQCRRAGAAQHQFLSRGFSVHETCLRQGVDLWKFMHEAVFASIANTTPPSLSPRPLAAVPTG